MFYKAMCALISAILVSLCINITSTYADEAKSPVHYQYELNGKERDNLLEKLKTVKIGDSINAVKKVLGNPTQEENLIGKKGEFNSTVLEYYLKRVDIHDSNINDQLVSLYFDKQGKLREITKSLG